MGFGGVSLRQFSPESYPGVLFSDMSKRFTETTKWADPWFRNLTPRQKCLWLWLCDNCDCAGVVPEIDWGLVSFQIGEPCSNADLAAFVERLEPCGSGFWLRKFVAFQWGYIDEQRPSMPQRGVLKALQRVSIPLPKALESLSKGFPKGFETLKDKDKDKDKVKDKAQACIEPGAEAVPHPEKKSRKVERNAILDALATIGGGKAEEIPPGNWAGIAKALSEIRAVCPELTIEELQRRARNYRTRFEGAALTPFALAKHWATCGTSKWSEQGSQVYR